MSVDWTAFPMADALRTAIEARVAGFDPVPRVVTYLPSPDEQMPDAIVIGYLAADSDENQRAHVGGNVFEEAVNLISRIQVTRPGAGQDIADDVRTRAKELLAEVDDEIRDNLPDVDGKQTRNGKVIERDMAVIATLREQTGSMLCAIDFNINYRARTS